jgi:ribosome-binding factor A
MSQRRTARLNEQFKREISRILRREVRDPRIGLPTVTAVEATPDLWSARIFVRPGPTEESEAADDALLEGLVAATPFIRRSLGQSLTLRRVPELRFELDRTLDRAMRVEKLLREVLPEEDEGEGSPGEGEDSSEPGEEREDERATGGTDG